MPDDKPTADITDNEIIKDALLFYTNRRHDFANAISRKSYRNRAGAVPSIEDVHRAYDLALRCDELLERFEGAILKPA